MTSHEVAVVDYGAGNVRSVAKALEYVGSVPVVTSDPEVIRRARSLILPGQGACGSAMKALEQRNLIEPILSAVRTGVPFFGVCLGLHLLFDTSEESNGPCLGLLPGKVRRLPADVKVPHMGWNTVSFLKDHPVFEGIPQNTHFYFVHSYYSDPTESCSVLGVTSYGTEFCSVVARGSMVATQFHPEKSGKWGLRIYANFLNMARDCVVQRGCSEAV